MFKSIRFLLLFLVLQSLLPAAEVTAFQGRWRLDPSRSSALDGWTAWDLVIRLEGTKVHLRHDMQWRKTKRTATNTVDFTTSSLLTDFFRVEQRHAALYPAKNGKTSVRAAWLDGNRTLRLEAETPIETSQGESTMRIYSEYRLLEGDDALLLIELHHSRPRPLVYRFTRVADTP